MEMISDLRFILYDYEMDNRQKCSFLINMRIKTYELVDLT